MENLLGLGENPSPMEFAFSLGQRQLPTMSIPCSFAPQHLSELCREVELKREGPQEG